MPLVVRWYLRTALVMFVLALLVMALRTQRQPQFQREGG